MAYMESTGTIWSPYLVTINCAWSAKSSRMRCTGLRSRTSRNKPPAPPKVTMLGAAEARAAERRWFAADLWGGLVTVESNLVSFETGRRLLMIVGEQLHS